MSALLARIQELVSAGRVRISAHGYDELANDDVSVSEVLQGVSEAVRVEEYAEYHKGPCVLALQKTPDGRPLHVLWGMSAASSDVATLITAYRPDPDRCTTDYLKRLPR